MRNVSSALGKTTFRLQSMFSSWNSDCLAIHYEPIRNGDAVWFQGNKTYHCGWSSPSKGLKVPYPLDFFMHYSEFVLVSFRLLSSFHPLAFL
jgi:hypothetical protein